MTLRGGRYYLRRHIPIDIQTIVRRLEVWRSLKTDSLQSALRRYPIVASALESQFERIRAYAGLSVDQTLLRPCEDNLISTVCNEALTAVASVAPSLAHAYAPYMDDPTHRWSVSTRQAYEATRRFALGIIGNDIAFDTLARSHCREYWEVLRHMPRNAAKRFPKLSLREASDLAREHDDIELVSAANANAHLANFSSFLNWAVTRNSWSEIRCAVSACPMRFRSEINAIHLARSNYRQYSMRLCIPAVWTVSAAIQSPVLSGPGTRASGCRSSPCTLA